MDINIKERTEELFEEMRQNGWDFNGISIDLEKECAEDWRDCWAIFIVDVVDFDVLANSYVDFDEDGFWNDFIEWLSSFYDEKTKILWHSNTGEVEIFDPERMKRETDSL